jgi:hypothetical protein
MPVRPLTEQTKVGEAVNVENVSGAPGLPVLNGSQLTGITAGQVGADPAGTAASLIGTHTSDTDAHHTEDHKDRHKSGGADAFASSDILEATVKRLQTTDGPTTLLMGAVADGEFLKRSGTGIIGATSAGAGDVVGPASATDGAVALYDGISGKLLKDGPVPGANNGLATLDGSGDVPDSQIPSGIARDSELHAEDHKDRHKSGGADAFVAGDILEATVKRLQTTTGPATLLMGAVTDGEYLRRSGTAIISGSPGKQEYVFQRRGFFGSSLVPDSATVYLNLGNVLSNYIGALPTQDYAIKRVSLVLDSQDTTRGYDVIVETKNAAGTVTTRATLAYAASDPRMKRSGALSVAVTLEEIMVKIVHTSGAGNSTFSDASVVVEVE